MSLEGIDEAMRELDEWEVASVDQGLISISNRGEHFGRDDNSLASDK